MILIPITDSDYNDAFDRLILTILPIADSDSNSDFDLNNTFLIAG